MAHKIKYILYQILPFRENELGINHWDTLLQNLSSLKKTQIKFIITGNKQNVKIFAKVPVDIKIYFKNTFYSNYPTSDIKPFKLSEFKKIYIPSKKSIKYSSNSEFFTKEELVKDGNYMDPINDIFAIFQNIDDDSILSINFNLKFKKNKGLVPYIKKILRPSRSKDSDEEEKKESKPQKQVFMNIGIGTKIQDKHSYTNLSKNLKSVFSSYTKKGKTKITDKISFFGLSYSQTVNFFHIPLNTNFVKGLDYVRYRKLPYPSNIATINNTSEKELTILGKSDYRGEKVEFGIKKEDKLRHLYIVGKTGTGKSTFISNMVKSDMENQNGLCLIDPHGDLIDTVIEHIPSSRINDVVLFDVADTEYPIGFNLLQYENEDEKNRIVSGIVSTFHKLFEHSWGPRLEYILRNVVLTVIEYPNATLMHILRILVDKEFRKEAISHVSDTVVLKFWNTEFDKWNDKQREEAVAPITNKIGQFLSSKVVRNIFGQPRTKLSLRKSMDDSKIILINLSKGKIGEDNASMIGSLLVTKFQIDAMGRADIPYEKRKDFYLYIDEFQNFASESFATILSEARKYKLSLIIANQFISQLKDTIKDAIFGNVGTIISFTLGNDDANIISNQFKGMVSPNDLISLPRFTAYTRLMVDGLSSDPFTMITNPLSKPLQAEELIEKIKKQTRQRYSMEKEKLEKLLNARSLKKFNSNKKVDKKAKLEGLGLNSQEIENYFDSFVQQNLDLFEEYKIQDIQPDMIIFDTKNYSHKICWYQEPDGLEKQTYKKFSKGQTISDPNTGKPIQVLIDMYQHNTWIGQNNIPVMIRIGSLEQINSQIKSAYQNLSNIKPIQNIKKLETKKVKTSSQEVKDFNNDQQFDISMIKIGQEYEGYVKLIYNYGIFVTVKGVEGLLHKNFIKVPEGIDWKKYYNIGDKIKVIAKDFKIVKGEKKVVWVQ